MSQFILYYFGCSIYPLNFLLIFWISLLFLRMELLRKKWAANDVYAAIIWVDSIYAREYYIANGVWMLQNQQQGRRSRGTWALPNSNGGGGAWHPGKHGEATNRKNPPGGFTFPGLITLYFHAKPQGENGTMKNIQMRNCSSSYETW